MKTKQVILIILLLSSSVLVAVEPNRVQSTSNVVNLSLFFHSYSLLMHDSNNSFYVYDGADGAPPTLPNVMQTNVNAQISGQRSGWNYWSGVVMWAVQLPSDLHVSGTVNMRAYISSNYKFSGFISGGGYGMGLVDIDENNVEVKEFITESTPAYGNPFTETPTQYSLNTNVDYVFKKGHAIGFAVGLGGTEQGFTATVYSGSPDRNSGVTLPVEDVAKDYSFTTDYNGASYTISITSNSAISNCQFDSATKCVQFKAQGFNYTSGYCYVWVPKTLVQAPFTINQGTQVITPTASENATYTQLYFTHTRNADLIQLKGSTTPPDITSSPTSEPNTSTPADSTPTPTASAPTTTSATPTSTVSPPSIPEYTLLAFSSFLVIIVLLALLIRKNVRNWNIHKVPRFCALYTVAVFKNRNLPECVCAGFGFLYYFPCSLFWQACFPRKFNAILVD